MAMLWDCAFYTCHMRCNLELKATIFGKHATTEAVLDESRHRMWVAPSMTLDT